MLLFLHRETGSVTVVKAVDHVQKGQWQQTPQVRRRGSTTHTWWPPSAADSVEAGGPGHTEPCKLGLVKAVVGGAGSTAGSWEGRQGLRL